jgi:hypothetical protein
MGKNVSIFYNPPVYTTIVADRIVLHSHFHNIHRVDVSATTRASHFYLLIGYSDFIVHIFSRYYNNAMFNHDVLVVLQKLCIQTTIFVTL